MAKVVARCAVCQVTKRLVHGSGMCQGCWKLRQGKRGR